MRGCGFKLLSGRTMIWALYNIIFKSLSYWKATEKSLKKAKGGDSSYPSKSAVARGHPS